MSTMTPLAYWLQEQVRSMGISQNALARLAGVSPATLTSIRKGEIPKPATLEKLAKATGVDVETLLEISGIVGPLPDLPADVPPEGREFLRRLQRLPTAEQLELLRMVSTLLDFSEAHAGAIAEMTRQRTQLQE